MDEIVAIPVFRGGGEFDTSVDLEKACIAKGKVKRTTIYECITDMLTDF